MEYLLIDREKAEILDCEFGIDASWFHKKSGEVFTIYESMVYKSDAPHQCSLTDRVIQAVRGSFSIIGLKNG